MAYATIAEFTARKDCRVLSQLASNSGAGVPVSQFSANQQIEAALDSASGEIESACNFAKRYTPDQLAALTGNSKAHLARITCDIAFWLLLEFRPDPRRGTDYEYAEKRAREELERLRNGQTVFTIQENIDAGLPGISQPSLISGQCGQPTTAAMTGNNVFPSRGNWWFSGGVNGSGKQ